VSIPLAARAYPVEWRSNVDVDRERQSSGLASPLDHASNAHPAERLAALIDEDVGRLDPVGLLLPLQELETVHLVPLKVMDAIGAALEPADDDGAFRQVDVIPAQITGLRDPQAVSVDDQSDQPIPVTVPVALECPKELVYFPVGQMLPNTVGIVPPAVLLSDWSHYEQFWPAEAARLGLTFPVPQMLD
jgi:hypothetical protein